MTVQRGSGSPAQMRFSPLTAGRRVPSSPGQGSPMRALPSALRVAVGVAGRVSSPVAALWSAVVVG